MGNFTVNVRAATDGAVIDEAERGRSARPRTGRLRAVLTRATCLRRRRRLPATAPARDRDTSAPSRGRRTASPGLKDEPRRRSTSSAGAVIVATGFDHYAPRKGEYGYERHPAGGDTARLHPLAERRRARARGCPTRTAAPSRGVAFIHCVGSRQAEGVNKPQADGHINEYCSRVCCTATLQAICDLQAKRPAWRPTTSTRTSAPTAAVTRSTTSAPPRAAPCSCAGTTRSRRRSPRRRRDAASGAGPRARTASPGAKRSRRRSTSSCWPSACSRPTSPRSSRASSSPSAPTASCQEVHPKLRPVELAVNGVLVAGTAQGPKDITETAGLGVRGGGQGHRAARPATSSSTPSWPRSMRALRRHRGVRHGVPLRGRRRTADYRRGRRRPSGRS